MCEKPSNKAHNSTEHLLHHHRKGDWEKWVKTKFPFTFPQRIVFFKKPVCLIIPNNSVLCPFYILWLYEHALQASMDSPSWVSCCCDYPEPVLHHWALAPVGLHHTVGKHLRTSSDSWRTLHIWASSVVSCSCTTVSGKLLCQCVCPARSLLIETSCLHHDNGVKFNLTYSCRKGLGGSPDAQVLGKKK